MSQIVTVLPGETPHSTSSRSAGDGLGSSPLSRFGRRRGGRGASLFRAGAARYCQWILWGLDLVWGIAIVAAGIVGPALSLFSRSGGPDLPTVALGLWLVVLSFVHLWVGSKARTESDVTRTRLRITAILFLAWDVAAPLSRVFGAPPSIALSGDYLWLGIPLNLWSAIALRK
ncbi:MAG: hypothetical protein ACYDCK_09560 [Thermoplasmatota archaeon]